MPPPNGHGPTRRQFLACAAMLAATAPTLGAYLTACSKSGPSSVAIVVSELGSVAETKTELERRPIAERSLLIDCVYRHTAGRMDGPGDIRPRHSSLGRGAGSHDRTGLLMADPGFSSWN